MKAWVLVPWTLLPQGTPPEMIQLFSSQMRERREESKLAYSGMFSIDSEIPGSVSVRCWIICKVDACYSSLDAFK